MPHIFGFYFLEKMRSKMERQLTIEQVADQLNAEVEDVKMVIEVKGFARPTS